MSMFTFTSGALFATGNLPPRINEASHKVRLSFNRNCMVTIFPESSFSAFSLIEFLGRTASY